MAVISWLPTGAAKSEPVVEPIMITVESAVSDTLTVTAVGQEPQTCITDVNGIGTMSLMPDVEYTFTSSVAKAIDNSGNDYSKTIALTKDMDGSLVKIMPDGALYWYGNECTWNSGGWNCYSGSGTCNKTTTPNALYLDAPRGSGSTLIPAICQNTGIEITEYIKAKFRMNVRKVSHEVKFGMGSKLSSAPTYDTDASHFSARNRISNDYLDQQGIIIDKEVNISSLSGVYYASAVAVYGSSYNGTNRGTVDMYAIWLE